MQYLCLCRYMAPEVALGRSYGKAVDVYSFGVLLWQLLRNKIPYRNISRKTHIEKVVLGGYRMPLDKSWPPKLQTLVSMCWHEDKTMRPDFRDVLVQLDALIEEADAREHVGWNFYKNMCMHYVHVYVNVLYSIRAFVLVLSLLLFVILLLILNIHMHTLTSAIIACAYVLICLFFGIYISFMSYIRSYFNNMYNNTTNTNNSNNTGNNNGTNAIIALEVNPHQNISEHLNPINSNMKNNNNIIANKV